ncbi:MAG: LPS-assembly protein LptD [Rhodospirillales bacterium]|nr:LPS-assembly protein LptD [Rhodospirillales bacterium]
MRRLTTINRVFFLLLAAWFVGMLSSAHAQANEQSTEKVRLNADNISYDERTATVTATGNVEIKQGERILIADQVSLNEITNTATAQGNVTLLEPNGNVIFADFVRLSDEFRNGILENLKIRMTDDSRLAANGARRTGGYLTEMSKAVFSPCKLCKKDPNRPPLWQIKATEIIHNEKTHDIEYKDAFFEMWGVPVLYMPYFSHPDPTVKRRSGFLAPSFGNSTLLGFVSRTPYYYVIDQSTDATITPIYTTDQGPVLALEYRQRLTNGELEIAGSGTKGDLIDNLGTRKYDQLRGHINAEGRFDIDPTWRWGFDVNRATDDTYLRRYNFEYQEVLTTNLYAEGFRGRNYAAINNYLFQDTRPGADSETTPRILPTMDYNFVSQPSRIGSFLTLDTNVLSLSREKGIGSQRISAEGGWHLPFTTKSGHVLNFSVTVRGDGYYVSNLAKEGGNNEKYDYYTGRILPQLSLGWRYPLMQQSGTTHQLIEPMAAFVAAPNNNNPSTIPNEDSLAFEFDETDLFQPNRYVGLDRVENGQRMDYGLKLGTYGASGGETTAFFGQSFRLREDHAFSSQSGLDGHFSDYVGRVRIAPSSLFNLNYRFRLDKDDLTPIISDLSFNAGPSILNVHANYLSIDSGASSGELEERREIIYGANSQLTENWSVSGRAIHNLVDDEGLLSYGFGANYQDECFSFSTDYTRSFTRDRDVEPNDTIFFTVFFKHLGQFSTSQDVSRGNHSKTVEQINTIK